MRPWHLLLAAALVVVAAGIGAGVALAYWATGDDSNPALAVADIMPTGPRPALTGIDGQDVTLSWAASTTLGGRSVLGATVARYAAPTGGSPVAATGACSGTVAVLTCTEPSVPAGTWYYAITPRISNWAGAEGARSTGVVVVAPTITLTASQLVANLPDTVEGGAITHFKAGEAVAFHLDTAAGTALTGSVAAVGVTGQATGFSVTIPVGTADGAHAVVAVGGAGSQAASNTFTVDTTAPVVTLDSLGKALLGPADASTVLTWHAGESGTYSVRVGGTSCATGTEVATAVYSAPTQVATTVSATALAEGANTLRACVVDAAAHTGSVTTVVSLDTTGPTGGSVTYTNGYVTSATVGVTLAAGSDAVGGIAASGQLLQRAMATLSAGSCVPPFGAFLTLATEPATSPSVYADTTVASGTCYEYRYLVVDNAGNTTTYSSAAVVKVDTSAPTFGSPALTLTAGANSFVSATTAFYNSTLASGFTVAAANAGDPQSGLLKVNFPAAGSGVTGGGDVTGPTYSAAYATSAGATATGQLTVTATDNALLTATSAFTITPDGQAPAGGALAVNGATATSGGSSTYSNSGTFSILRTDFTDAVAGLASSVLTRTTATLATNSCGAFGSQITLSGTPAQTGLTSGCYRYVLTGTDKVGNVASLTTTVMVDTTAPATPTLAFTGLTNAYYGTAASTLWFRPAPGGVFTVTASSADAESGVAAGIAGYTFGSLNAGGGANFSNTQTAGANTYTFGASASAPSSAVAVFATNNAGSTSATTSYSVVSDSTAPTAPIPTVTASYYTTASVPVSVAAPTDTASGVATIALQRDQAALSGAACGSFAGTFASSVTLSGGNDTTVASGFCYQYRLVVTDNVGNQAASGLSGIAKVDASAPTTPVLTFSALVNAGASGTTVSVRSSQNAGTFTVTASSADPQTGVSYAFPTFGPGWTTAGTGASRVYSWSSPNVTVPSGSQTVTVTNAAGLTSTVTFTVVADNTNPLLTDIVMANGTGSTAGIIDQNDRITLLFSEEMDASKFCATWTNGTTQGLNDLVITVDNHGGHDNISITSTVCPTLNVLTTAASLNTNANYVNTNLSVTFTGALIWNPTNRTITITFGTVSTNPGGLLSGVGSGRQAKLGPPAGLSDVAGNGLSTSIVTAPTPSGF